MPVVSSAATRDTGMGILIAGIGTPRAIKYSTFLFFASVALVCGVIAIKKYAEYQVPWHVKGEKEAISSSFEDWKANFIAKLSEGAVDSTIGSASRASIPSDHALREIYEALKARGVDTHKNLALLPALPSAFASALAIVLCAIQWRMIKGMSTRHLAALIPVLLGLVSPTVAFFIGQLANSYVAGGDADLDGAVLQTALSLPLVTACTLPGFLGLAAYLYLSRKPLLPGLLWPTSLTGTGILTAIVLVSHTGMYDLLYSRGRMHSTTGIGIMFVSFSCLFASAVTSVVAWTTQRALLRRGAGISKSV
jgi:hypothetical protein